MQAKAIEEAYSLIQRSEQALTDANLDLTPRQYNVLAVVAENGRASMADMARRLMTKPTVITGLVDKLEDRRFVERRPDRADRRFNWIHVTELGYRALACATEALEQAA